MTARAIALLIIGGCFCELAWPSRVGAFLVLGACLVLWALTPVWDRRSHYRKPSTREGNQHRRDTP